MKPMLASKLEHPEKLRFPVLASPKLDGIRCLIINGQAVSRNLKPIPNMVVSEILRGLPPMDGELIVGPPGAADVFNRTSSGVMSKDGIPKFTYWVFDALTANPMPFKYRLVLAKSYANASGNTVKFVAHKIISNLEELNEYEAQMLLAGYEGIMVRDPGGPYKQGRSTEREGWLLKVKRFEDAEAKIIGFQELEHNNNERTTDELGRAKRSSHKANKQAANKLGAFIVQRASDEQVFNIGTGFTEVERVDFWERRGSLLGKLVKYSFQPAGVKDAPRFPVFLGMRDEADT